MIVRRWVVAVGAALALAGCSTEAKTFSLRLTWTETGAQACPAGPTGTTSCADIPMSCDARVLIRIVPLDGDGPYYSHCYQLTGATDACALADLDIETSQPIPNEMVRLQVAVWSTDQLRGVSGLSDSGCPSEAIFDDLGQPKIAILESRLVPALGGEIYFPVGDRHVAEVPLGCPRFDQLDLEACRIGAPIIDATLRYLNSRVLVEAAEASSLLVHYGAPTIDADGAHLFTQQLDPLEFTSSVELPWEGRLTHELPAPGCLRVQVLEPATTAAALCRDPVVEDGRIVIDDGFVVDQAAIDEALRPLALSRVPASGLVLGVVVDHNNRRLANAHVTVSPAATVEYPSQDNTTTGLNVTNSRGLFLSTDAPFGAEWHAVSDSGLGDDGAAFGGLIAGHVTLVVLRINPPVGGGTAQ